MEHVIRQNSVPKMYNTEKDIVSTYVEPTNILILKLRSLLKQKWLKIISQYQFRVQTTAFDQSD